MSLIIYCNCFYLVFKTRPFDAKAEDPALPILLKARPNKSSWIPCESKDPSSFIDLIGAVGSPRPPIRFETFLLMGLPFLVAGGAPTLIRIQH